jgi:hypothetical protein
VVWEDSKPTPDGMLLRQARAASLRFQPWLALGLKCTLSNEKSQADQQQCGEYYGQTHKCNTLPV